MNKEAYVLERLSILLEMIDGLYKENDAYLIPPDFIEVNKCIEEISKTHKADMDTLNQLNSVWRRVRLMRKAKDRYRVFLTYQEAMNHLCKDIYNDAPDGSKWDKAEKFFIENVDWDELDESSSSNYLQSLGFHADDDPDEEDDLPF